MVRYGTIDLIIDLSLRLTERVPLNRTNLGRAEGTECHARFVRPSGELYQTSFSLVTCNNKRLITQ
jgi:hypothetical protein